MPPNAVLAGRGRKELFQHRLAPRGPAEHTVGLKTLILKALNKIRRDLSDFRRYTCIE